MLYCLKCKKYAYKTHKCNTKHLISVTKNMLPIALKASSLGLQVTSAFCLTNKYNQIEAGVYFKCTYPDELLQDLPTGWYWTDYVTLEHKAICSCLSYEAEYVYTSDMSLEEFIANVINDLLDYLATRNNGGIMSVLTLLES